VDNRGEENPSLAQSPWTDEVGNMREDRKDMDNREIDRENLSGERHQRGNRQKISDRKSEIGRHQSEL
jgi:hypothetical protein